MEVRERGDEDGLLNWMGVCESLIWRSINTCSRVVLKEGLNLRSESGTSSLFNTTCPISSMDLTVWHNVNVNLKSLAMLAAHQVLRPNFEETLHFLYLVLWAWKGLSESTTIHTPMCRLGMTRKWCLLAGFRSLKATNESSWGIRSH